MFFTLRRVGDIGSPRSLTLAGKVVVSTHSSKSVQNYVQRGPVSQLLSRTWAKEGLFVDSACLLHDAKQLSKIQTVLPTVGKTKGGSKCAVKRTVFPKLHPYLGPL